MKDVCWIRNKTNYIDRLDETFFFKDSKVPRRMLKSDCALNFDFQRLKHVITVSLLVETVSVLMRDSDVMVEQIAETDQMKKIVVR